MTAILALLRNSAVNNFKLVAASRLRNPQIAVNQRFKQGFITTASNYCNTMSSKMDSMLNDQRRHFDYDTLLSKKKDGALLVIDVRQPEELAATGTIPDSINIPLNEVEDALAGMTPEAFRMKYGVDKPSKGTLIVFSCQSGRRSVTALGKALFHGYLNAGNFKGGWLDWESHTKNPQP